MGKFARIAVFLGVASIAVWFLLKKNIQQDGHGNLDLEFYFDPPERFKLDSKNSWIVTVIVILVASSLIAL